jgi:hypothetical protein
MGASWRRAAPVLLLALAAAWSLPASAGTAEDPEVTDPAGDQAVTQGALPVTVPGVNDEAFDDVDVLAAYVAEFGPSTRIVVQTAAGWTTGSMTLAFNLTKGPDSLPSSTAAGRSFTVHVNGTTVAGVNGTAATTTDGLRIDIPTEALGAVGGDVLAGLSIATARTDPGNLADLEQDDQAGSDEAGPGRDYTFSRPAPIGLVRLDILGGTAGDRAFNGSSVAGAFPSGSSVRLRVTNEGLDADEVSIVVGRPGNQPVGTNLTEPILVPAGGSRTVTAALLFPNEGELPAGSTNLTFTATSALGARVSAVLRIQVPGVSPEERGVRPAGLGWLTSAAEGLGLDGAFGAYAEAFLLALIVLLAILAIYLLLALGRSTLAGAPAPEAPFPDGAPAPAAAAARPRAAPGPSGLAETVRAKRAPPAATSAASAPAAPAAAAAAPASPAGPPPGPATPAGTAPVAAIRIEEVRHQPQEPEAGQRVTTEVILRNDGPAAALRLALSVDGKPAAERTVQVPSRATKAIELPWTAGPGDNRVRIQAFPA